VTKEQLAAKLNDREYTREITREEEDQAKQAGLVVVFGYSDDNIELRGAIDDEYGAYKGTTIMVDREGIVPVWEYMIGTEVEEAEFEKYFQRKQHAKKIKAIWNAELDQFAWTFETEIPHATFEILEDAVNYCRGIVFSIDDLKG